MKVVREIDSIKALLRQKGQLRHAVVQGLDLGESGVDWACVDCEGAVFLGCHFPEGVAVEELVKKGATVFPKFPAYPFDPYRPRLYSREELMEGWSAEKDGSRDKRIYDHFEAHGRRSPSVVEALAERLHDHAIDDALRDLLEGRVDRAGKKKVVAIMGGHGTSRADPYFRKVVQIAQRLTQAGYFVTTGGGPGMMEAGNLGAYLADLSGEEVDTVISILARAPTYRDADYTEAAQEVLARYPHGHASLAVPTWFYGHEPSNLFSKHIAKYFSNSLREDGLLAIAMHGVVFAPGSAGTTQEVFQDACQNHYQTFEKISPMVFLGKERFGESSGIYDCLAKQAVGKPYAEMLLLTDEVEEVLAFVKGHPPRG